MPNKVRPIIEPGIYFGLPEDEYHAAEGLSCSGMKHLSVSPLNYWHYNLNADCARPEETYPQRFGKAVHTWLLERDDFWDKYAVGLSQEDFPGLLVTVDDLKAYCELMVLDVKGKKKQDLIDRITATGDHPPIWDVEKAKIAEAAAGKVLLKKQETAHLEKLGAVVAGQPLVASLLTGGMPEVSFFVRDPETGMMLKARMDYVRVASTIDLKTFSNSRGKPTDKVIYDAIFYEKYHWQTFHYHKVRELTRQALAIGEIATHGDVSEAWIKGFIENANHGFGFIFIESAEPFDMRVIGMKQSEAQGGESNIYWLSAGIQIEELTALYAECKKKYGSSPWRDDIKPHVLVDQDIPQLAFS